MVSFSALRPALASFGLLAIGALATAQPASSVVLDFEGAQPLNNSRVAGRTGSFSGAAAPGVPTAQSGAQTLRFTPPTLYSYDSFTYDLPIDIDTGTVTVRLYDTFGNPGTAETFSWRMSVLLEDANNPGDFGGLELADLPYGNQALYGVEGLVDYAKPADKFDSGSFPNIVAPGWRTLTFTIGATSSTVSVNGSTAVDIGAPGSNKTLRLRFMADSATVGGFDNWTTTTSLTSYPAAPQLVYIDNIDFAAVTPAPASATLDFETDTYDRISEFMVAPKLDIPEMRGFAPKWKINTNASFVDSGTQSCYFGGGVSAFQAFTVDLANVEPGILTMWFYDTQGPNTAFNKFGGTILLENKTNTLQFQALEIHNWPYPSSGDPTPGAPNYYLTRNAGSGGPTSLFSRYFGNRQVGWNKVEFILGATASRIRVNGIENSDGGGLSNINTALANLRLRIMGDSASSGGFSHYLTIDELDVLYQDNTSPYLYFDALSTDVDFDTKPDVFEWFDQTALVQAAAYMPPYRTNALLIDSDGDGLNDATETTLGTNPRDEDSDNDGWWDGLEVAFPATFPNGPLVADVGLPDADADGVPNSIDPDSGSSDADGDLLSDEYELGNGLATLGDANNDGNLLVDDVTSIGNYGSGASTSITAYANGDVNGDGVVTAADAAALGAALVGNQNIR